MAEILKKSELTALDRSIDQHLYPYTTATGARTYWLHQLSGDEAKAREALKKLAAKGVPLPVDVK